MILPMFVIGLLNVVSFLIPSHNTEKVSLSLNVLLATAVFIGVVHDDLPDRSDAISSVGESGPRHRLNLTQFLSLTNLCFGPNYIKVIGTSYD